MINFNVYEFCQNCSYFEAETRAEDNDGVTESGDTIYYITCAHKLSCMHAYSAGLKSGVAEALALKDLDGGKHD